jgi:hypothetical protein
VTLSRRQKRPRADQDGLAEPARAYQVIEHERKLRCRDNLLLVANKDFSKALDVYKAAESVFMAQAKQDKQQRLGAAVALPVRYLVKAF